MHVSFSEIVNKVADDEWGRDFETTEDAAKAIVGDKQLLNAWAVIELIKRFNAIGRAAGNGHDGLLRSRKITLDGDEKKFPNKSVGDRLYGGDLLDGIQEFVIIAKDSQDHCMIVLMNDFDLDWPPKVCIADECHKETLLDAVKQSLEENWPYYADRAAYTKEALEAVAKGEDLTRFLAGFEDEDDEAGEELESP
jgi:hypothetical protein